MLDGKLVTIPAGGQIELVNATTPGSLVLITPSTNSATVYIGGSAAHSGGPGIPVPKGSTISLPTVGGTGQLYVAGTANDVIYYYYGTEI